MKKLLVVLGLTFAFGSFAQKIKVESGSYDFLKGVKELNVEFDYSDLKMLKENLSESEYIENRKNELNEKNAGEGDSWVKKWEAAKDNIWQPKFLELVNDVVSNKVDGFKAAEDLSSAKYTLIVEVKWIYPGWDVYVSKQPAKLTTVLKFVETDNRENVLLELNSTDAPGTQYGPQFSNETRVGESFAKTGKTLGGLMWKKGMK
jgi:hypothetical protein